jgi:23S rRNA pseudouridine1911/1915/1917 synthase
VDGRAERKSYRVAAGEVIDVGAPEAEVFAPPAGVRIAYEDDDVLVVDKPAGVVVHAAPGLREGTLVDALLAAGHRLARRPGEDRPGIVHRLDRDVSGVLLVAKDDAAYEVLAGAMARREIERTYTALVAGVPGVDRAKIDAPIGRSPRRPTRMAVLPDGRPSVTWVRVVERFDAAALIEVTLETGRTHQIRVHLESIGHPVIGDAAYGRGPAYGLKRPFLHARKLAFAHPVTGARVEVESPLPDDLTGALERIRDAQ